MTKIEMEDVEEILEKEVKNGKVMGLTKWEGQKVKIIIVKEK